MGISTVTRVAVIAGSVTLLGGLVAISPAFASGPNHGRVWESGIGGIHVNAQIWIQPSYSDGGQHAAGGRVHLWRQAGPAVNVYGYSRAATSRTDMQILTVKKTVNDSILPGASHVTHGSYATTWFSSGGGGCAIGDWSPAYRSTGVATVDKSAPADDFWRRLDLGRNAAVLLTDGAGPDRVSR